VYGLSYYPQKSLCVNTIVASTIRWAHSKPDAG
jgi:hypothetical protein